MEYIFYIVCIFFMILGINKKVRKAEESKAKSKEENLRLQRQKEENSLKKQRIDSTKMDLLNELIKFARQNKRVSRIHYDIEEGGDYVSELDAKGKRKVENIMEDALEDESIYLRKTFEDEYLNRIRASTIAYNPQLENYYRIQSYNKCPKEIQIKEITIERIKKEILKLPIVEDKYLGFD